MVSRLARGEPLFLPRVPVPVHIHTRVRVRIVGILSQARAERVQRVPDLQGQGVPEVVLRVLAALKHVQLAVEAE